jgi:site-specific DNA recombinase
MKVALYTRVSTTRQQQTQTIEQQLDRLQTYVAAEGWSLAAEHIFRDEGYSGTRLNRPGLDRLRDGAAMAEFERVLITAPDRLARNYVHQMVILEELEGYGCPVEFMDRPMSNDPHDQLVLQIRGAVAEYEQTLIADRMRRGRLRQLQAGRLLPWTRAPYGYILDAERPRDASRIRIHEVEAAVVEQMFAWYADPTVDTTLYALAKRLTDQGIPTPRGGVCWNTASIRGIFTNPAYTGTAYAHRFRKRPAQRRKSALQPVPAGEGVSDVLAPKDAWIPIPVPALINQELFDQVQARLTRNQQMAPRNNTRNSYLLRGLVSCQQCRLSCFGRTLNKDYRYYVCRGKQDALRASQGQHCPARYAPAQPLETLVWDDLCQLLTHPEKITQALERAQTGAWLPQEMQARGTTLKQAVQTLTHQEERLLEAYLAEVIALPELERKRTELSQKKKGLQHQQRQLEAQAQKHIEIASIAVSIIDFCQQVQAGLDQTTFAQRRQLIELLIDRVVINDDQVEIRYVIPTSEEGTKTRFCHLRTDYFNRPAQFIQRHNRV